MERYPNATVQKPAHPIPAIPVVPVVPAVPAEAAATAATTTTTTTDADADADAHYRRPGRPTRAMNALVGGLTKMGVSVAGSRILQVPGRTSGIPRRTPVNLLRLEGGEYLVSPRGTTEWVRNVRAAGGHVTLQVGRRRDRRAAVELLGAERIPVLRAYLARWAWEVGAFFDGVGAGAPDNELAAVADHHPVFLLLQLPAITEP